MIGSVGSSGSTPRSVDSSPTSRSSDSSSTKATQDTSLAQQEAAAQDVAATQQSQALQRNYMADGMEEAAPSDYSRLSGTSGARPASPASGSSGVTDANAPYSLQGGQPSDAQPVSRATPASDAPGSTQEVLTKAAQEAGVDPNWAQSPALDSLLNAESSSSINGPLNTDAANPSGAYGIGQLMPETQAQYLPEGADPNDPVSQATAMMGYIRDRYGSPEAAWSFHQSNGWY